MSNFKSCLATQKLFKAYSALFILVIVSCGGNPNVGPHGVLMSMSVSPTSADAQNFPNGQVQFTATGTFSLPPSPAILTFMAPYVGGWSSSNPLIATIDHHLGVAQCVQGAAGTVTITALAASNAPLPPGGVGTIIPAFATATLNCP